MTKRGLTPDMRKRLNDRERAAHKMECVAHELAQIADILLDLCDENHKEAKQNSEAASKFAKKLQGKYNSLYQRYEKIVF